MAPQNMEMAGANTLGFLMGMLTTALMLWLGGWGFIVGLALNVGGLVLVTYKREG